MPLSEELLAQLEEQYPALKKAGGNQYVPGAAAQEEAGVDDFGNPVGTEPMMGVRTGNLPTNMFAQSQEATGGIGEGGMGGQAGMGAPQGVQGMAPSAVQDTNNFVTTFGGGQGQGAGAAFATPLTAPGAAGAAPAGAPQPGAAPTAPPDTGLPSMPGLADSIAPAQAQAAGQPAGAPVSPAGAAPGVRQPVGAYVAPAGQGDAPAREPEMAPMYRDIPSEIAPQPSDMPAIMPGGGGAPQAIQADPLGPTGAGADTIGGEPVSGLPAQSIGQEPYPATAIPPEVSQFLPEGLRRGPDMPPVGDEPALSPAAVPGGRLTRPLFEQVNEAYGGRVDPEQFSLGTPNMGLDPLKATGRDWETTIVDALRKVPSLNKQTGKHNVNFLRYDELEGALNGIWGITNRENIPENVKTGRLSMMRRIMRSVWLLGTQASHEELREFGVAGAPQGYGGIMADRARLGQAGQIDPNEEQRSLLAPRPHRGGAYGKTGYSSILTSEREDNEGRKIAQDLMNKYLGTELDLSKHDVPGKSDIETARGKIGHTSLKERIRDVLGKTSEAESGRGKERLTGVRPQAFTTSSGRTVNPGQGDIDEFIKENLGAPNAKSFIASDPDSAMLFLRLLTDEAERSDTPSTTRDKIKNAITDWQGANKAHEDAKASAALKEATGPAKQTVAADNLPTGPTGGPKEEPVKGAGTLQEVMGLTTPASSIRGRVLGKPLSVPAGAKKITDKATLDRLRRGAEGEPGPTGKQGGPTGQPETPAPADTTGHPVGGTSRGLEANLPVAPGPDEPGYDPDAWPDDYKPGPPIETLGGEPVDLLGGDIARANVRTAMEGERPAATGNSKAATDGTFAAGKKGDRELGFFEQIVNGVLGARDDAIAGAVGGAAGAAEQIGDLLTNPGQATANVAKSLTSLESKFKKGFVDVSKRIVKSGKDYEEWVAGGRVGDWSIHAEQKAAKAAVKKSEKEYQGWLKGSVKTNEELIAKWDETEETRADAERLAQFETDIAALNAAYKKDDASLANMALVAEAFGNLGEVAGKRTASHFLLGMNNMPKKWKADYIHQLRKMNKEEKDNEVYRLGVYQLTGHEFPQGTSQEQMRTLLPTLYQEKQARAQRAMQSLRLRQSALAYEGNVRKEMIASFRRLGMDADKSVQLAAMVAKETIKNNIDIIKLEQSAQGLTLDAWNMWTTAELKKRGHDAAAQIQIGKAIIAAKGTQVSEIHVRKIGGIKTLIQTVDEVIKMREQDPSHTNTGPIDSLVDRFQNIMGFGDPKFRMFRSKVMAILNTYVNAITGKQMSQVEVQRIKSVVPKVTDPEHVFLPLARTFRAYMILDMRNYIRTLAAAGYNVKGLAGEIPLRWKERGKDGKWTTSTGIVSQFADLTVRDRDGKVLNTVEEVNARRKDFRMMDDAGQDWKKPGTGGYSPFERGGRTVFKTRAEILALHKNGKLDAEIRGLYEGMGPGITEQNPLGGSMPGVPIGGQMNVRGANTGIPPAGQ